MKTKKKVVKTPGVKATNYLDKHTLLVHIENNMIAYDVNVYFAGGVSSDTQFMVDEIADKYSGEDYGRGSGFGFRDMTYGFKGSKNAYGFYSEMLKLVSNGKTGYVTLRPHEF